MDGKKISFGFSKITKKPTLQLNKNLKQDESSKIELIKCLEGQQIKLVEERKVEAPLVIPLKDGGKTSAALASLAKRRAVLLGEDDEPQAKKNAPSSEATSATNGLPIAEIENLDKRAESEILAELQAKNEATNELDQMVLPVVKPDELPLDGAKEATLDDYESIPVDKYGWAMLRGMGATEPPKSADKLPIDNGPMQRPPGLGLGADKALKSKPLLEMPEANEKLEIKKQAFVRILAGKHKDAYGQIEGFDHERGTIIVKLAIGNTKQKFQEFLCQPVSKKEYAQYSKCINKAKYEEYKKQENEHGQVILKKEDNFKYKTEKIEKHEVTESKNMRDYDRDLKSEEFPRTSSSRHTDRYRSRSRSRSTSRSKKYNSEKRHDYDALSDDYKKESESESDSRYEHRKSKSSSSKSINHKKKHKRRYSSSSTNDSVSSFESDGTENERKKRHKHDKKKKSKKKTKKSKKARSRTPTRRKR